MRWSAPFAEFEDAVVLVTGASSGIGAAVALAFATCGARVVVHYNRHRDEAAAVTAKIATMGGFANIKQADLAGPAAGQRLVEEVATEVGRLDVLVNNAGHPTGRWPVAELNDARYETILDLNLGSVFGASRAAAGIFRRQRKGTIVNTTSLAARNGGGPGASAYAAAKAGVATLTRAFARELAVDGIRVNAVSPGYIETPLQVEISSRTAFEAAAALAPLGRAATPEECVGAYLFLASERLASFITGQVIEVNGGILMP